MEVSRLSGMDNDLFTYKVEVANIPCNSIMDDDLVDETDDDIGYDPSNEKVMAQLKEMKRLADLKAEKEKSKKLLKKILNPATIRAQTQKMAEHEAKRQKLLDEYNHQISFRADQLPITKISYVVNPNKEATMKITRGDNPLNLIVHPNFRLKTQAKFQWVINQAKKLGLPPPPALATFEMTAEDKKRKRTKILKEVFVTENVTVDGMHRNLVPPLGIEGRQGLVIREPESGIFFYNENWDCWKHKKCRSLPSCNSLSS
ncbi:hypothetical protein Tco_1542631 [Tanacetum coccineum]